MLTSPNAQLAKDALDKAIKRNQPDTNLLMFHSDQRVQYSAKEFIPKPLEAACFRKPEQIIIKAALFINGYSLKKRANAEHDLLRLPHGAVL